MTKHLYDDTNHETKRKGNLKIIKVIKAYENTCSNAYDAKVDKIIGQSPPKSYWRIHVHLRKSKKGKDQESIQIRTPHREVTKTQKNITLSQQVTTRLQGKDNTVWQLQSKHETQIANMIH